MPTETLRPNAAGDSVGTVHAVTGGSGTNHGVTSDDLNTSYLRNNADADRADAMNLGAPASVTASDSVDSIDVRFSARTETSSGTATVTPGVRLGGTSTMGSAQGSIPTSETSYTQTAFARPGGGSWAHADLADLQVVVQSNDGTAGAVRIFELHVDVNYTVGGAAPKAPPPQRGRRLLGALIQP